MPLEETHHLVRTLFSGPEGRAVADRIDRRVDRLPGLGGLGLMDRTLRDYGARPERRSMAQPAPRQMAA